MRRFPDVPPPDGGPFRGPSGCIAQLVEQLTLNQRVLGSSPSASTIIFIGVFPVSSQTRHPQLGGQLGVSPVFELPNGACRQPGIAFQIVRVAYRADILEAVPGYRRNLRFAALRQRQPGHGIPAQIRGCAAHEGHRK